MSKRPETGPMKFGDDWAGVFIRGDEAYAFAAAIKKAISIIDEKNGKQQFLIEALEGLIDTLNPQNTPVDLRSFENCLYKDQMDFLNAPKDKWRRFRDYDGFDLWLHEGFPLTVLFPDGSVAEGTAKSTIILRADTAIKAWGVVVDGSWFDLIDLKVDCENLPGELKL